MISTSVNEGVDSASHDDGGEPSQTSGAERSECGDRLKKIAWIRRNALKSPNSDE